MSKPVVFVIGASGNVGSATVTALSHKYLDKVDIKAGVRDPAADRVAKLKDLRGVSIVTAKMGGDKAQLAKCFSGVESLFIVTPTTEDRAELAISTTEAAKEAGVKFVLLVSVLTADLTDTVFGAQFNKIETAVSQIGVSYCFIRLPLFVEVYWRFKDSIKSESKIYNPVDPHKPFTPVVVADAGNAAAAILAQPQRHTNKTYKVISNRHTFSDVAAAFSESLGKEVKYNRVSYEEAKRGLIKSGSVDWKADGVLEYYKLIDEGSPVINEKDLSQYEHVTGEKPTELKTWVDRVAVSFK